MSIHMSIQWPDDDASPAEWLEWAARRLEELTEEATRVNNQLAWGYLDGRRDNAALWCRLDEIREEQRQIHDALYPIQEVVM